MNTPKCISIFNLCLIVAVIFTGIPRTILDDINRDGALNLKDAILYAYRVADNIDHHQAGDDHARILKIIAGIEDHPTFSMDMDVLPPVDGAKLYLPASCEIDQMRYFRLVADVQHTFHSYIGPADHRPPRF